MGTTHCRSEKSSSAFRLIAVVVSLLASVAGAFADPSTADVAYVNERLSANFTDTTAATAFERISALTGISVQAPADVLAKRFTLEVDAARPEEVVRRILRAISVTNSARIIDRRGQTRFLVLDGHGTRPSRAVPAEDIGDSEETPAVVLATREFSDVDVIAAAAASDAISVNE